MSLLSHCKIIGQMDVVLTYRGQQYNAELPNNARGSDLLDQALSISKLKRNRLRVVYEADGKRIPVTPDQSLADIKQNNFLIRDLGPQFSYYGVFMIEYLGPFCLWIAITLAVPTARTQFHYIASAMWLFHYGKRILETNLVHTFSHSTMPLRNLFKNSTYYWGFAAAIAWFVAHAEREVGVLEMTAIALFFVFELLNFYCHVRLRLLRPKGSTAHVLPRGFLFDSIACPNYTMEILAWISFAVFVRVWPAYLFPIVGGVQMLIWADQKRKRLMAEFPEARNRGRITPFKAI